MNERKIPKSAGLLVYRTNKTGILEYLLVHPSGSYHRKSPYYIPKGKIENGETEEAAAIRETYEKTGINAKIVFDLGSTVYKTKTKKISIYLAEFIDGNVLEDGIVDWPDWENDIKRFVPEEVAQKLLREEMLVFLDRAKSYFKNLPF